VLAGNAGGETGAPEVKHNPIPREHYHTDWIADRAISHLGSRPADQPFFAWISFPDPHHPFDPPHAEVKIAPRTSAIARCHRAGHDRSTPHATTSRPSRGTGSTGSTVASRIPRADRSRSGRTCSVTISFARSMR
jgi:hypothetical protein